MCKSLAWICWNNRSSQRDSTTAQSAWLVVIERQNEKKCKRCLAFSWAFDGRNWILVIDFVSSGISVAGFAWIFLVGSTVDFAMLLVVCLARRKDDNTNGVDSVRPIIWKYWVETSWQMYTYDIQGGTFSQNRVWNESIIYCQVMLLPALLYAWSSLPIVVPAFDSLFIEVKTMMVSLWHKKMNMAASVSVWIHMYKYIRPWHPDGLGAIFQWHCVGLSNLPWRSSLRSCHRCQTCYHCSSKMPQMRVSCDDSCGVWWIHWWVLHSNGILDVDNNGGSI
jgi:hypothetical protein